MYMYKIHKYYLSEKNQELNVCRMCINQLDKLFCMLNIDISF